MDNLNEVIRKAKIKKEKKEPPKPDYSEYDDSYSWSKDKKK